MNNNEWLDHSSVYGQQQNKFYRWILYPTIVLFIFIALFLVFAKREIVIKTTAKIVSEKSTKLQTPSDFRIKENNLLENKEVKKGETLVSFDMSQAHIEKELLETENSDIELQKKSAQIFIDSINQNQNLFETDDSYGYSNQLKSFFAEREVNDYTSKQSESTFQKSQEAYQKTANYLEQQISSLKNTQNDWEKLRVSWINQTEIQGLSSEQTSKYQSWKIQLLNSPEEEKTQLKSDILSNIDDQLVQIKKEIEQIQGEQVKLVSPVTSENEINIQIEKGKELQEQALSNTKQKIEDLSENQRKNMLTLKTLNNQLDQEVLKSPVDGTIHLNEDLKGQTELPKGTIIAEIYPKQTEKKLSFTAFIPADEITRVKINMPVHFKIDKKGLSTKTINGSLKEISENSSSTEKGTFYTIKGTLEPSKYLKSRYGQTGEVSLIIGKKTYWQQIKNSIF